MHWPEVETQIRKAGHPSFSIERTSFVGGGCVHRTYRVEGGRDRFFVKLSQDRLSNILANEAHNLSALAATGRVRVPRVICHGKHPGGSFLVLEHLHLKSRGVVSDRRLGTRLALLHQIRFQMFGWDEDNFIGDTPQINRYSTSWIDFWRECRLRFQLELAGKKGYGGRLQRLGERLMNGMGDLFQGHSPYPSLLHGDLWAGNAASLRDGEPVVYDPACYYGDRETDLAMTELFGGFSGNFYAAYFDIFPRQPGYEVRKRLYNLYHVLNHLNLFGPGYLSQAETLMERLLVEIH